MEKNKKLKAQLPKGFRDNSEDSIDIRNQVINIIRNECEQFGFKNIETPALEYTEALGKFLPDVDRPSGGVFSFQDDDGQWLSMRYDLTAPLARYVAENYQFISKPFKRYQFGSVWRNEKPGPGRYREFIQFDADAIGISNNYIDAELCVIVARIFKKIGFSENEYKIKYSSRIIWENLFKQIEIEDKQIPAVLRAVDKLDRVGINGVKDLLLKGREDQSGDFMKGVNLKNDQVNKILDFISNKNSNFWASGISVVAHMQNPYLPSFHFNTRMIETSKIWFGGGMDMTPTFKNSKHKKMFHSNIKNMCDKHDKNYYKDFSQYCDEYFYLPHRKETRGDGGIFYDYLNSSSWEADFNFTKDVGSCFLDVVSRIISMDMSKNWKKEHKEQQKIKRGRYAEFNLLYDRGTKFGLQTDGNIDAILMSMPPEAKWI